MSDPKPPRQEPVPIPPDTPTLIDLARATGIISSDQARLLADLAAARAFSAAQGAASPPVPSPDTRDARAHPAAPPAPPEGPGLPAEHPSPPTREEAQAFVAPTPSPASTGAETILEPPPGGITPSFVHKFQRADTVDEGARAGPARPRRPSEILRLSSVFSAHAVFNIAEMPDVPEEARAAWLIEKNRFGKYILVTRVGAGAMGEVWRAWQIDLPRWVALKFLKGDNPEEIARFVQEARTAAKLAHANIVTTYEAGELQGRRYIAMEFLEGADLSRGALETRAALEAIRDAARAVHYAHEQQIIHRDLKPSNLVLTRSGRLCVTDFGLAKSLKTPSGLSQTGALLGTPYYMSPEQAAGRTDLDGRSDVFALGATLYHLLTGRPPFTGNTWVEILRGVLQDEPIPPRYLNPALGRDVETIVLKCLEKEPARRYESARALQEDLDRSLRGEAILARPASLVYKMWLRVRRHKAASAAAAALVGTLSVVGAVWAFTPGKIQFAVAPAGARVRVGEQEWIARAEPRLVSLPAGVYEMTAELAGHDPETRTVAVERGRTKDLTLRLAHHQGRLEAESHPQGSEIEVDGVAYGSRVRNLALDTGPHRLRAWSLGHYTREAEVEVEKGGTARAFLWLEPGVAWTYGSTGIPSGIGLDLRAIDIDGDGVREMLHQDSTDLVFRRAVDGAELRRLTAWDSLQFHHAVLDLGGDVGRVLVIGGERNHGAAMLCVDPRRPGSEAVLWHWQGPAEQWPAPCGMMLVLLSDLNGDGVAEIAGGLRRPGVVVLDGKTGKEWAMRGTPVHPGMLGLLDARDPDRLLFGGPRQPPEQPVTESTPYTVGCLRISDGALEWTTDLGPVRELGWVDLDGDGLREVQFRTAAALHVAEGRTGSPRWSAPMAGGAGAATACGTTDLDGDGLQDLLYVDREGRAHARSGADGHVLWERALGALAVVGGPAGIARGAGGELVFRGENALAAVDPKDGSPRWSTPGDFLHAACLDVDRDGTGEIVAGQRGVGLVCFGGDGKRRWTLSLAQDVSPADVFDDVDGDGQGEIAIHASAAMIGVVRPPLRLWSRPAAGPLQAAPIAVDLDGDGGLEVIQLGPWGQDRRLACLDGRSGRVRWTRTENTPPNRGPGVGDFDGDGRPDLVIVGARARVPGPRFMVFRGSDGEIVREWEYDGADLYCRPAVADANGDGVPEVVYQRWSGQDLACTDGKTGRLLWRLDAGAPGMGGVEAADLDGDGGIDFVAPFLDGRVHAVRGKDGVPLWSATVDPEGSRAPAAAADVDGAGAVVVFVVSRRGTLWALEGKTGATRWTLPGGSEGLGRPEIVRADGGSTVVVAPLGAAGVVAAEAATGALRWHAPERKAVLAAPRVRDLDGDGLLEVVVATAHGDLEVLDFRTGASLWRVSLGGGMIESDPEVADLDGDGVLDILVADHDGMLHAVSGRGTRGARRSR